MAGRQTRKAQEEILDLLSEEKENLVILPKDIMISLLQCCNVVATLHEKTLCSFNTVPKSINQSNNFFKLFFLFLYVHEIQYDQNKIHARL